MFVSLNTTLETIESRIKAEHFRQRIMLCFRMWEDNAIYHRDFLIRMQNIFLGLVKVCFTLSKYHPSSALSQRCLLKPKQTMKTWMVFLSTMRTLMVFLWRIQPPYPLLPNLHPPSLTFQKLYRRQQANGIRWQTLGCSLNSNVLRILWIISQASGTLQNYQSLPIPGRIASLRNEVTGQKRTATTKQSIWYQVREMRNVVGYYVKSNLKLSNIKTIWRQMGHPTSTKKFPSIDRN